jgi:hypothetical protein
LDGAFTASAPAVSRIICRVALSIRRESLFNIIYVNFEDNAIVTVHGVEWLYPPNSKILLIR